MPFLPVENELVCNTSEGNQEGHVTVEQTKGCKSSPLFVTTEHAAATPPDAGRTCRADETQRTERLFTTDLHLL